MTGHRRDRGARQTAGFRMIDHVLRGVRALVAVLRVLAGVLLVASVALNFANVVGRYFFSASIYWAEEIMLFLMVGCVFLGNGVVAWSGRQLRMDVIVDDDAGAGAEGAGARLRAGLHRRRHRHRGVRLAGDPRSLEVRPAQPVRRDSRWSSRRPWCRSGFPSWRCWSWCALITGGERDPPTDRALMARWHEPRTTSMLAVASISCCPRSC